MPRSVPVLFTAAVFALAPFSCANAATDFGMSLYPTSASIAHADRGSGIDFLESPGWFVFEIGPNGDAVCVFRKTVPWADSGAGAATTISARVVPTPGAAALGAVGLTSMGLRRRRRR